MSDVFSILRIGIPRAHFYSRALLGLEFSYPTVLLFTSRATSFPAKHPTRSSSLLRHILTRESIFAGSLSANRPLQRLPKSDAGWSTDLDEDHQFATSTAGPPMSPSIVPTLPFQTP